MEAPIEAEKIFVCISLERNQLHLVCYSSMTTEIVIGKTWEYSDFAAFDILMNEISPDVVIANNKISDEFKNHCKDKEYDILFEQNTLFDRKKAKANLLLINLPNMVKEWNPEERLQYLSAFIDINDMSKVIILGSLLEYLLKNKEVNQLEPKNSLIQINSIKLMKLDNILLINYETILALQIFKTENHPSMHQIGKSKEGLSLFGLLNKCKTPVGKKLLKQWFLRPIIDMDIITKRQNATSHFLLPDNLDMVNGLKKNLPKFKDVPRILSRIRAVTASVNDWCHLFESILAFLYLSEIIKSSDFTISILRELVSLSSNSQSLENLVKNLNKTIDFDLSKYEKRIIPKESVDEQLDELRHVYDGLDSFLTEFATEEFKNYNHELIPAIKCVYYPQLGFLLAIPILLDRTIEEQKDLKVNGLKYQFHSERFVFYKSKGVLELDEHIGDIYCSIMDIESKIIRSLESKILKETPILLEISELIAELDCEAAKEYNWKKPDITINNCISIEEGRHPLQELCVDQFIPNNIYSNCDGKSSLSIIFGPNYSGKSVYLKQIGLITYMALIGSFVPASKATIGLVDRIFSRIHSLETSKVQESSFLIDLKQISNILLNCTPRSLVLIDEFGKGTLPNDGVALLAGTIRYLKEKVNPKCWIGTHFQELQNPDIIPNYRGLQYLQMDHVVQENSKGELEIVYLYKVSFDITASLQSWGIHCSRLAGIPDNIISRAKSISDSLVKGKKIYPIGSISDDAILESLISNGDGIESSINLKRFFESTFSKPK